MKSFRQAIIFLKSLPGRFKRPALPSFYNPLAQFGGMLKLVLKRQSHHRGLTLLALVGIILTVGLVTDASFFSTAVDRVILLQELKDFSAGTGRPPSPPRCTTSLLTRHPYPSKPPKSFRDHQKYPHQPGGPAAAIRGPGSFQRRNDDGPAPDSQLYASGKNYLGDTEVVYMAGVGSHLKVQGQPFDDNGNSGKILDVWMHQDYAQEIGVNVGETLQIGINLGSNLIPVRLAGFWRSSGPDSNFWFNDPDSSMKNVLLVRRNDYIRFVQA